MKLRERVVRLAHVCRGCAGGCDRRNFAGGVGDAEVLSGWEASLEVRASGIRGGGQGLFTRKRIPAGSKVVEYTGVLQHEDDGKHDGHKYCYGLGELLCINALDPAQSSLARYANDARGSRFKNNVRWAHCRARRVWFRALRDIEAGEEIFVGYGNGYWASRARSKPRKSKGGSRPVADASPQKRRAAAAKDAAPPSPRKRRKRQPED